MVNALAQEETIRDLRRQLDGLSREDEQEVIFRETSARRGREMLYRMTDGEPVPMKLGLAKRAIHMLDARGNPKWTTDPEKAPKWVEGQVKCFMHPEAPERETLALLGIPPVCDTGNLRNNQAKRDHAEHCHKREWAAFNEHESMERERVYNDRQDRQLEATLAIAGKAAGQPAPRIVSKPIVAPDVADALEYDANGVTNTLACECGWTTVKGKSSLGFHKRLHCKLNKVDASG